MTATPSLLETVSETMTGEEDVVDEDLDKLGSDEEQDVEDLTS